MTALPSAIRYVDCRSRDKPNAYLVDDGDWTLVDSGWAGDEETLRAALDDAGIGPAAIDRVLLTHHDVDHVGGLASVTPDLDAPRVRPPPLTRPTSRASASRPGPSAHLSASSTACSTGASTSPTCRSATS